ncbi:MAG TPA: hypothetical protein VFL90_06410, partial [Methylomirabilota bacterium]|nr:hypothetical protein [Methylomirabilota bacterium]
AGARILGVFSGGSYDDVARWLKNFLTSHAKREDPRAEVLLEAGDEREGRSYGARLVLGARAGEPLSFDYKDVAAHRGQLAWCAELAARTRVQVKGLLAAGSAGDGRAR